MNMTLSRALRHKFLLGYTSTVITGTRLTTNVASRQRP